MQIQAVWQEALPDVMKQVTGVGVWAALRAVTPITLEGGTFVIGLDGNEMELAGHLKLAQPKRVIEETMARYLNEKITCRVITGRTLQDWETEKRRDEEKRRLQLQAIERQKQEIASGKSWEKLYEQLTRIYATLPNRSLPQNRAKFFLEAIDLVAETLVDTPLDDDMAERSYARCLERISQYTEIPSTIVALKVLEKTFGG
jgi:hypothetical protein